MASDNYPPGAPVIDREDFVEMELFLEGFRITPLDSMIIFETKAVGTHHTDIVTLSKNIPSKLHGRESLEKSIKDLMHPSRGFLTPYPKKAEFCFHLTQDGGLVYKLMKEKGYNTLMEYYEDYKKYFSVDRIPYNPLKYKPAQYITSKKGDEDITIRVNQIETTDNKLLGKEGVIIYESRISITIEGCPICSAWINTSFLLNIENLWAIPFVVQCQSCENVIILNRYLWSYSLD